MVCTISVAQPVTTLTTPPRTGRRALALLKQAQTEVAAKGLCMATLMLAMRIMHLRCISPMGLMQLHPGQPGNNQELRIGQVQGWIRLIARRDWNSKVLLGGSEAISYFLLAEMLDLADLTCRFPNDAGHAGVRRLLPKGVTPAEGTPQRAAKVLHVLDAFD